MFTATSIEALYTPTNRSANTLLDLLRSPFKNIPLPPYRLLLNIRLITDIRYLAPSKAPPYRFITNYTIGYYNYLYSTREGVRRITEVYTS